MSDGFTIDDLMPADSLERIGWVDCLRWASGFAPIIDAFAKETGVSLGRSPLDRAIDKATGYDAKVARQFVEWFNANVWGGEEDAAIEGSVR